MSRPPKLTLQDKADICTEHVYGKRPPKSLAYEYEISVQYARRKVAAGKDGFFDFMLAEEKRQALRKAESPKEKVKDWLTF